MPAKVTVLFFASARDAAGRSSEVVQLTGPATASDLLEKVVSDHPRLAAVVRSVRLSVNCELVAGDAKLKDGDEVGILPPVAGG